jgi:hypothetical protein
VGNVDIVDELAGILGYGFSSLPLKNLDLLLRALWPSLFGTMLFLFLFF